MEIKQIPAPSYLKDHIQYFWTLESNGTNLSSSTLGPLVDGCPGMIFQHVQQGIFYDHQNKPLPQLFLYGQTITRTEIQLTGKFKTLGVTFYPNTLKSIFGFNANEITDSCLDINLLSNHLSDQLLSSHSQAEQIELLSSYLLTQIRKANTQVDTITRYALSKISQSKGNTSLKDLQKELKLSERSLERRFNQYVGISPKLFSRICRFQASLSQLKKHHYEKLSDVAFDNGYADQSHFIREFKEFAGYSPYQFQK